MAGGAGDGEAAATADGAGLATLLGKLLGATTFDGANVSSLVK